MKTKLLVLFFVLFASLLSAQVPCSGTPAINTAISNIYTVCPGQTATLSLLNTYANSGISYLWEYSTSTVLGPYTLVPGSNAPGIVSLPVNTDTWYRATIVCSNSNSSVTTAPVQLYAQGTATSSVPYYEGFSGIQLNNYLPNCSWTADVLGGTALTFTSGGGYASFYYNPSGSKYFITNPIWLDATVIYSTSLAYRTDNSGANWTDLSLLLSQAQSTANLTSLASTNGPVTNTFFATLSNTFTVPTSGFWYEVIMAISTSTGTSQNLDWDELRISIPCNLNAPALSVSGPTSVCFGQSLTVNATGADSYTWNTGVAGPVLSTSPGISTAAYTVTGTDTLSGCSSSAVHLFTVSLPPMLTVQLADVCKNQSGTIYLSGAASYSWNGVAGPASLVITPTAATVYTITGASSEGCIAELTRTVNVLPLPVLSVSGPSVICAGETASLNAGGALNYTWTTGLAPDSNGSVLLLSGAGQYTLEGSDFNGCTGRLTGTVSAEACLGIHNTDGRRELVIFPNPNNGVFRIESGSFPMTVRITDLRGAVVFESRVQEHTLVDGSRWPKGVYFVSLNGATPFKLIVN